MEEKITIRTFKDARHSVLLIMATELNFYLSASFRYKLTTAVDSIDAILNRAESGRNSLLKKYFTHEDGKVELDEKNPDYSKFLQEENDLLNTEVKREYDLVKFSLAEYEKIENRVKEANEKRERERQIPLLTSLDLRHLGRVLIEWID